MRYISRKPFEIPRDARILVRTPNWIGDVVIGTASLACVRHAFPEARITALAKPWVIPVLKHNPHLDEIILYDRRGRHQGVSGVISVSRYLRGQRFDAAILFQRAFEAALIAYLARIPVRMGYSTDARGFLLTHKVESTEEEFLIHRLEHDLKLLEGFGIGAPRKELVLNLGVEQKGRAKEIFRELGISPGDRVFAMSPGSVHLDYKRWLPDRFASLAGRMVKGFNARGILLGTPNEREICEGIIRRASVSGLDNLAGRTSLEEAIALAALCGLFVTNDSGLMHVAAALDVPLVAIFGPTDPRKTAPWSRRSKVVRNEEVDCFCRKSEKCTRDQVCMTGISVDQVFREAEKMAAEAGFDLVAVREERVPVSSRTVPLVETA